jgi:hypothetical protein
VKQEFRIRLNGGILYNHSIDTPYKIDLLKEPFTIKITNLSRVLNRSDRNPSPIAGNQTGWALNPCAVDKILPNSANLTGIQFYDQSGTAIPGFYSSMVLTADDGKGPQSIPPALTTPGVVVKDTIELSVQPLWPPGTVLFDDDLGKYLEIDLTFDNRDCNGNPLPHTLVTGTFLYDYFNVTRPALSTGMLEVGVW